MSYLIGIAGGSASGKTTFINQLTKKFDRSEVCVISQDHYYRPLSDQPVDENGEINFDLPEGIDFGRLRKDIKTLMSGKEAKIVEYTFNNPNKFPKPILFNPAPVLIVEGLFIYTDKALDKLFDLKLYIEANLDLMYDRRLKRDRADRGMDTEQIQYQWENHVLPAYQNYLLPYRDSVDMVVMNNTHFQNSFDVLANHIKCLISAHK